MKKKEIIGDDHGIIVPDDTKAVTVDISQVPFLLNAAGIRVLYHAPEENSHYKMPTTANYTVSVINPDGTETPLNLVQSIKFELSVDEVVPLITLSYIDYPTKV